MAVCSEFDDRFTRLYKRRLNVKYRISTIIVTKKYWCEFSEEYKLEKKSLSIKENRGEVPHRSVRKKKHVSGTSKFVLSHWEKSSHCQCIGKLPFFSGYYSEPLKRDNVIVQII